MEALFYMGERRMWKIVNYVNFEPTLAKFFACIKGPIYNFPYRQTIKKGTLALPLTFVTCL